MAIPENIRKQTPADFGAIEIRHLNNRFYVYQVTSKWDAKLRRSKKITGKCVGKITELDGFIVNANGMRYRAEIEKNKNSEEKVTDEDTVIHVRKYGAYETLTQISPDVSDNLKSYFPDKFPAIRTFALLRLIDHAQTSMMSDAYYNSYLSDYCPDIGVSEKTVQNFISNIGLDQKTMDEFMKHTLIPQSSLLFDGTSIFWHSNDALAESGYNSDHDKNKQTRVMYIFDKDSHRPIFYRIMSGSQLDKTSIKDLLFEIKCENCLFIADKGFYSKANISTLAEEKINFILPLNQNTTTIDKSFYVNTSNLKFTESFTYNGRLIWGHKIKSGDNQNWIYIFKDEQRAANQYFNYVSSLISDAQKKGNTNASIKVNEDIADTKRYGYFAFCSNLDVSILEIYLSYKNRWDIEELFDELKNSSIGVVTHAHSEEYFRGITFLNHISILYFYGLINKMRETGLDKKYSPQTVLNKLKVIYKVRYGNEKEKVSYIQKKTEEIIKTLGVTL